MKIKFVPKLFVTFCVILLLCPFRASVCSGLKDEALEKIESGYISIAGCALGVYGFLRLFNDPVLEGIELVLGGFLYTFPLFDLYFSPRNGEKIKNLSEEKTTEKMVVIAKQTKKYNSENNKNYRKSGPYSWPGCRLWA